MNQSALRVSRIGQRIVVEGEECPVCGSPFVAWNKGIERLAHAPGRSTPVWRTFAKLRCREGHLTELSDAG